MTDSTNPRVMADNIRELDARILGTVAQFEALQIFDDDETDKGMKWIDGSPIYRKVVDLGDMPNNTTSTVAHNISDLDEVITFCGIARNPVTGSGFAIDYRNSVYMGFNNTNVTLTCSGDFSAYKCKVIIEYTKTPPTP